MDSEDMVILLGSTLRFTMESPSTVPLVRKLWVHQDICFAQKFETLLYAFYHWGVHVLSALQDDCTALYGQFIKLGCKTFVKEHVGPLLAAVGGSEHEQWTLNAFVAMFIDRVTQQTFRQLVSCRMQACICTLFNFNKPTVSSCFQQQADQLCNQLASRPPQEIHIVYETPAKDIAQYPRHKKRKTQDINGTKKLLIF